MSKVTWESEEEESENEESADEGEEEYQLSQAKLVDMLHFFGEDEVSVDSLQEQLDSLQTQEDQLAYDLGKYR
jgi:hypothetical protein